MLIGVLGGCIVQGIHAQRLLAVAKHYPAYNLERCRTGEGPNALRTHARDVHVDERSLHEVYLEPFRRVIQDHGVAGLVCGYNRVNGEYASQSQDLLSLPRRLWGFEGFTVPDAVFAVRDAAAALEAGLDLPALAGPGPEPLSERTATMVASAPDDVVADIGAHVRAAIETVGLAPATGVVNHADLGTFEARRFAEQVAIEGATLLHNDGTLPLRQGTRIVVVGGEELSHRLVMGGSAGVPITGTRLPDLIEQLEAEGLVVAACTPGLPAVPVPALRAEDGVGMSLVVEDSRGRREIDIATAELPPDVADNTVPWTAELTVTLPPAIRASVLSVDFAVEVLLDGDVVGSGFREASPLLGGPNHVLRALLPGSDTTRTLVVRFRTGPAFVLPEAGWVPHLSLGIAPLAPALAAAEAAASDVDAFVMLAGRTTGAGMDADELALPAGQPELINAATATGVPVVVVTHGSGPIDMPWRERTSAILHMGFSGERFSAALARIVTGDAEPGGRLPLTFPDGEPPVPPAALDAAGRLDYSEGVDVGYRGYERAGVEPAFWFGHGLSYSHIELMGAVADGDTVQVELHCGPERGGKAVVQLYSRPQESETLKLVGFASVRLDAGQRLTEQVPVDRDALATWTGQDMAPPSGEYPVHVGFSRGDLRREVSVVLG